MTSHPAFPDTMSISQRVHEVLKTIDHNKGITNAEMLIAIGGADSFQAVDSAFRRMMHVKAARRGETEPDRWYPTEKTRDYHKGVPWKSRPIRKNGAKKIISVTTEEEQESEVDPLQNLLDAMAAAEPEIHRLMKLRELVKECS